MFHLIKSLFHYFHFMIHNNIMYSIGPFYLLKYPQWIFQSIPSLKFIIISFFHIRMRYNIMFLYVTINCLWELKLSIFATIQLIAKFSCRSLWKKRHNKWEKAWIWWIAKLKYSQNRQFPKSESFTTANNRRLKVFFRPLFSSRISSMHVFVFFFCFFFLLLMLFCILANSFSQTCHISFGDE